MPQPAVYIYPDNYALYGITATSPAPVIQAGVKLDAYLNRPEGLLVDPEDPTKMLKTGTHIVDYVRMPSRGVIQLTRTPVVQIVSVSWRAKPDGQAHVIDPSACTEVDQPGQYAITGVPAYVTVTVGYTAGFLTVDELPTEIGIAVGQIQKSLEVLADLPPGIKRARAGDAELERFGPGGGAAGQEILSVLDFDTRRSLGHLRRVVPNA